MYLSPVGLRESLVFDYTEPIVLTAFTSVFVHLNIVHLLVNLVAYTIIIPVLFILSVANGNRRRFYTVFLTFLVVFPFVLSYLNLAIFRPSVAFGFSGVVMSFVGYLPLALASYLDDVFGVGPANQIAPAVFLLSLICISVLSVRSAPVIDRSAVIITSLSLLSVVLSILLYVLTPYDQRGQFQSSLRIIFQAPGHLELILAAIVLLFAILFAAFPPDLSLDDGVLNVYVHFLGYALGFLTVFTTVETVERLEQAEAVF